MTTGLSQTFQLTNGKFTLSSGESKMRDNLSFFMSFTRTRRIYFPDYTPDLSWLIQSSSSRILQYKALFLGTLKNKILTYVPDIIVSSLNSVFLREEKEYVVTINFSYATPEAEIQQLVIFI